MHVRQSIAAAGSLLLATTGLAQSPCAAWTTTATGAPLDLAPLAGYTEICSLDAALCHRLTDGYPPSIWTLGYFVPAEEWAAFRRGETAGFRRYLIAQLARSTTPADLPGL